MKPDLTKSTCFYAEFAMKWFSGFFPCQLPNSELRYDTTKGGIGLEQDSAWYQLMAVRMNGIMNDKKKQLCVFSVWLVFILNDVLFQEEKPFYSSAKSFLFRSIISSIFSIYSPTSFTLSHRSILPFPYTRFVTVPAPRAMIVWTSSIIKML